MSSTCTHPMCHVHTSMISESAETDWRLHAQCMHPLDLTFYLEIPMKERLFLESIRRIGELGQDVIFFLTLVESVSAPGIDTNILFSIDGTSGTDGMSLENTSEFGTMANMTAPRGSLFCVTMLSNFVPYFP